MRWRLIQSHEQCRTEWKWWQERRNIFLQAGYQLKEKNGELFKSTKKSSNQFYKIF